MVAEHGEGWRFCVAPMLDITDDACRFVHRKLSRRARLYTEMVTTGALLHGDAVKLLYYDASEHPIALQLGGSDSRELALCAKMGEKAGYDEINLNCGCPSERVQKGAFGACLMKEANLVADCVKAMQDAVSVDVTVKHRTGVDDFDSFAFVEDFVGRLFEAGVRTFIVHSRKAWLQGLSPEENRTIPPLNRECVFALKKAFPEATIVLNGAIEDAYESLDFIHQGVDGVMLGRAVTKNPWLLTAVDEVIFKDAASSSITRAEVLAEVQTHVKNLYADDLRLIKAYARAVMGIKTGLAGARVFRRFLSDPANFKRFGADIFMKAYEASEVTDFRNTVEDENISLCH